MMSSPTVNNSSAELSPFSPLVWVLILFVIASGLATDLYMASLPAVCSSLQISPAASQWSVSIYMLSFALSVFPCSWLVSRFGYRSIALLGLWVFTLASYACSFAHNVETLYLFRFIQGFGGCSLSILSRAIARETTQGSLSLQVFAQMFIGGTLSITLGPILSTFLSTRFNWQVIFFALGLFGTALLPAAHSYLPKKLFPASKAPFFTQVKDALAHPVYLRFVAQAVFLWFGFFTFAIQAPFLFVHKLNLNLHTFGILYSGLMASMALGSCITRFLAEHIAPARLLTTGIMLALTGSLLFICLPFFMESETAAYSIGISLYLLGAGLATPCCQNAASEALASNASLAFSFLSLLQMLGCGLLGILVSQWQMSIFQLGSTLFFFALVVFLAHEFNRRALKGQG